MKINSEEQFLQYFIYFLESKSYDELKKLIDITD